jgi:hypothetical protein
MKNNRLLRTIATIACAMLVATLFSIDAKAQQNGVDNYRTQLSESDPNFSSSWNWETFERQDLYITGNPQQPLQVRLPFFEGVGPAAVLNVDRDVRRADGWVCLGRDFGFTPNQTVFAPYFILYNRYTGALRFFWWNSANLLDGQSDHAAITLEFEGPATANLSFQNNESIGNYDGNRQLYSMSSANLGWCYAEFRIIGYDPSTRDETKRGSTMKFRVNGVGKSALAATGQLGATITQILENSSAPSLVGGASSSRGILAGAASALVNGIRSFSTQSAVNNIVPELSNNAFLPNVVRQVLASGVNGLLTGGAGLIAGFVGSFLGVNSAPPPLPLKFSLDGNITLNGTITANYRGFEVRLYTPGTPHPVSTPNSTYMPLYDRPLGIYSVQTLPNRIDYGLIINRSLSLNLTRIRASHRLGEPITIFFNPEAGIESVSTTTAFTNPKVILGGYRSDFMNGGIRQIILDVPLNTQVNAQDYIPSGYTLQVQYRAWIPFNTIAPISDRVEMKQSGVVAERAAGTWRPFFILQNIGTTTGSIPPPPLRPVNGSGDTDKDESTQETPTQVSISQNYPNPFNPSTVIRYTVPKSEKVSLVIYDIQGREVSSIVNEIKPSGVYEATFNASNLASGTYFYRLQVGNAVETKKMLLIK